MVEGEFLGEVVDSFFFAAFGEVVEGVLHLDGGGGFRQNLNLEYLVIESKDQKLP